MRKLHKLKSCFILSISLSALFAVPTFSQTHTINSCVQNYIGTANDNPFLAYVNMENCNLNDSDIPDLLTAMNQKKFDGQLFLTNNNITAQGAILLSQYSRPHAYNIDHNPIGNDGLMAFLQDKNITWLLIGYNQVDTPTINKFIQQLASTNIHAINLANYNLTPATMQALASNTRLRSLGISHTTLSESDISTLMQNSSIRELSLYDDHLSENAINLVASNTNLKDLYLVEANVGDVTAGILAKSNNLESIHLNNNHITSVGLQKLLSSPSIIQIALDSNDIQDDKISINTNSKLQYLYLGNNKIGDNIANAIAEHLPELNSLDLSNNLITSKGFTKLMDLQNLSHLTLRHNQIDSHISLDAAPYQSNLTLDIGENMLGDAGFIALYKSERSEELIADHNQIGDAGAAALTETIKLSACNEVDLSYNNISDASIKIIALSNLSASLYLSHNNITDVGALALANPAEQFLVTDLDISYNKLTKVGVDALKNSSHSYFRLITDGNNG